MTDNQELRQLLEQVHAEIQHTETIDPKGQELLHDLQKDIHELLTRVEGEPTPAETGLIQSLEDGITQFEVAHPTLTLLLSNVLATLSNAGI